MWHKTNSNQEKRKLNSSNPKNSQKMDYEILPELNAGIWNIQLCMSLFPFLNKWQENPWKLKVCSISGFYFQRKNLASRKAREDPSWFI